MARPTRKKIDLLRTKAWAAECARLIGGGSPATTKELARAANDKRKSSYKSISLLDNGHWSRWLRGERGVSIKTVNQLWKNAREVFTVGPVEHSKKHPEHPSCRVPLWASISGDPSIIMEAWKRVVLLDWDGERPNVRGLYPDIADFVNIATTCSWLENFIEENIDEFPLLAYAAFISVNHLKAHTLVFLDDFSIADIENAGHALKPYNLTLRETVLAADEFGVNIFHDYDGPVAEEYEKHFLYGDGHKITQQAWNQILHRLREVDGF